MRRSRQGIDTKWLEAGAESGMIMLREKAKLNSSIVAQRNRGGGFARENPRVFNNRTD